MKLNRLLSAAIAVLLFPAFALAQQAILQGGPWTPNHAPMYVPNGYSQPIVQDSGPAGGGGNNIGLSELLLTQRSPTNAYPAQGTGTGPFGTNLCDYDAPLTNSGGYHYICLGPNVLGTPTIAVGSGGGASPVSLNFLINGTTYQFPGSMSGIAGPATSVINDLACWNNTTGSLLKDCGTSVLQGPNSSTANDIATFSNTSGNLIKDSGISLGSQAPNLVLATPSSGAGLPAFRALVGQDLPTPQSAALGGVFSSSAGANQVVTGLTPSGALSYGTIPLANPSTSISLTAVNGSATTAMRSDAAPALSQSITPTWTGKHIFSASPPVQFPNYGAGYPVTDSGGNIAGTSGCYPIDAFGATADGSTDNVAAWSNITTAIGTNSGCIDFGKGQYNFSTAISFTAASGKSITVRGLGSDVTNLYFPNATTGLSLTMTDLKSSFHFRDVSMIAATAGSTTGFNCSLAANSLSQAEPSDITNVIFRGSDGPLGVNRWATGINLSVCSNVNITGGAIYNTQTPSGTGIAISGTGASAYATQLNVSNYAIVGVVTGFSYGQYTQGVQINNLNIVDCTNGIVSGPGLAGTLSQLSVANSQSSCTSHQVLTQTLIQPVNLVNNLFECISGATGVDLNQNEFFTILGNTFLGAAGTGINIGTTTSPGAGVVADNTLTGFAVGINITSGAANTIVHDNTLQNNTTQINLAAAAANDNKIDAALAYTPTIAASSGTLTTASATGTYSWRQQTVCINVSGSVTTNGTGAGSLTVSIPVASATGQAQVLNGRQTATTGNAATATISSGASTMDVRMYDNSYPGGSGTSFAVSGCYKSAT